MKIWERYLVRETLKVFFLFLGAFYFLYAIIDYSMHLQEIFKGKSIPFLELLMYYGMLFSKRCDLLLPLALLIATVKVLCSLNRKNELIAFQTAGIPLHRLTRPIFFAGLVCVGLSYFNFQVITPRSLSFISHFEKQFFKKKKTHKYRSSSLQVLPLEDGSRLIYQHYDHEGQTLSDVFHIVSADEIWHMKSLSLRDSYPIGHLVDCMKRNEKRELEKVSSYDEYFYKNLKLNFALKDTLNQPLESRSISDLIRLALNKSLMTHESRTAIQTHLYFKLLMPWLGIYAILGASPFCVSFNRNLPVFLIFALTIFGFIAFFTLMDASVIMGETHVLPPFWAIFTLPILSLIIFGRNFIKKTC